MSMFLRQNCEYNFIFHGLVLDNLKKTHLNWNEPVNMSFFFFLQIKAPTSHNVP